jgi:hypothetical protein
MPGFEIDLSMKYLLPQRAGCGNSIQILDSLWDAQQPSVALARSALVWHYSSLYKKSNPD